MSLVVVIGEHQWIIPDSVSVTARSAAEQLERMRREGCPPTLAHRLTIVSWHHWLIVCLHAIARAWGMDWHVILDTWMDLHPELVPEAPHPVG